MCDLQRCFGHDQVMVRHCKEDIADIPRPVWRVTILPLNEIEAASYNAVIAVAKANYVCTGSFILMRIITAYRCCVVEKDYLLSRGKHQDSLLNPKNRQE